MGSLQARCSCAMQGTEVKKVARRLLSYQLLLTVMLLAAAPVSGAMRVDTLHVPMDLALALLGGQGGDTRIFVGALPAELEQSIPLGDAEGVVGGLVRGSGGTVVVQVPGNAPQALASYFEHLESQGWKRWSTPLDERGGFQRTDPFRQGTWCGERYSIRGSSITFDSKTFLRISYTRREAGRDVCDPPETRTLARRDPYGSLEFPILEPPPGAVVHPGGGGASSSGIAMEATIESDSGVELIFEHYDQQLAAAGWVRHGRAAGDGVAIGRWGTQDGEGEDVVGTMSVWALVDGDSYRAWLRLDRPERRR